MAYRRRAPEDAQASNTPTVAGLIRYLAAAFHTRMGEERLQTYLDALHGIHVEAIQSAVNTIRDSVQYDRLPIPSMVRALALQATTSPKNTPSLEELEAQRATPEEIDAAFEQARRDHPDSLFLIGVSVARDRVKRQQTEASREAEERGQAGQTHLLTKGHVE
jgi:hypothetical protein